MDANSPTLASSTAAHRRFGYSSLDDPDEECRLSLGMGHENHCKSFPVYWCSEPAVGLTLPKPGIVALHCFYAIYHLGRDAAGRTPASSAAYQIFSVVSDLGVLPFYAFGALAIHNKGSDWATILADQALMSYFRPAVYYTLIGAGGMHALTLLLSCWLFWMFRKISRLPPDMNPLEDHLTARPKKHKRNKSSINTVSTESSDKRLSTPLEARRKSGIPYEDTSRPPTVPFMHTRTQSNLSSSSKNTLVNLPDRQYQIMSSSPRSSVASSPTKRASALGWSHNGVYTEVPLDETSRPPLTSNGSSQPRGPKFTENWMPTDSLISRTNQRNREMAAAKTSAANRGSKSYAALSQPYNDDDSDSEFGADADLAAGPHPNPLGQNPTGNHASTPPRARTPFYPNVISLTEVSPNVRPVSGSHDIADEKPGLAVPMGAQRNRQSSIQGDEAFFARPYGDLKSGTPPVMIGGNSRKVSSGNDFDSKYSSQPYERRNVSGKVAEEGRGGAGSRFSRYGQVSEQAEW